MCFFCHRGPRLWAKDRLGQSEVWYQPQGLLKSFSEQLKRENRTSLVAQWLRILLPMQGHGFDPWCGKIPQTGALSPCAPTVDAPPPARLEPELHTKRSLHNEKSTPRTHCSPHSLQLEEARSQQGRPSIAKNKKKQVQFLKKRKNKPAQRTGSWRGLSGAHRCRAPCVLSCPLVHFPRAPVSLIGAPRERVG